MNRAIDRRLKKLEATTTDEIPVYCDDEADVAATISKMIASGEISETDRPRCVYWLSVTKCVPGTHERRLEQLDADEPQSENETS
jgi:hypothetical protein